MIEEIWRDIEGYKNYQVSNCGRVRNAKGLVLKPDIKRNGYHIVSLWNHNRKKNMLVHRLVAQAFVDNPEDLPEVNHKDEDKANNRADNLEWCSHIYNMNYGDIKKKMSASGKGKIPWCKGKKCPQLSAAMKGKPHPHKGTPRKKVTA